MDVSGNKTLPRLLHERAAAHPDKVAAMQERVNALGKECAKPLFLAYLAETGLKHAAPIIASETAASAASRSRSE